MSYKSTILQNKKIRLDEKQRQLIGTGIKYPIKPNPFKGNIDFYEYDEAVKKINQSIFIILTTPLKSRINQPDFGSNINRYIFDPLTTITAKLVGREIYNALYKWEKRIEITDILYNINTYVKPHTIEFTIKYNIIEKQVEGNYVFPFSKDIRPVLG